MGTQNPSVHPHAQARVGATRGLQHDNTRHTTRFTVIGNHLAQHRELSLLAIGLGTHLQSLPKGAPADIKTLTARFPEGATRIAAALRELECHGYLRRERVRTPSGRIVTRTVSCNRPGPSPRTTHRPEPSAAPEAQPQPHPSRQKPGGERPPQATTRTPRKPLPAVPRPECHVPALFRAAADLLADLRRHDSRLLLSVPDTAHLTPGVAAWLERDVTPATVRRALTADLPPEGLRRPAAFLAHRLAAQLPPPAPYREPAADPPAAPQNPLRNCDGCDRAFRAPEPGLCRECLRRA
ncbi:helix-turn-helix domain-containing protein [Streptomyces sp. SID7958]|uniref:Helix-turn-helix domain-containing protein n=2 Tax=unclassified Streptomyces TaxID=2593676 RepID=A0A6G3R431_9ACTN|nr:MULTISPECIES: helix-turn-helix domain-containing protein [unclassified Streptomyces]NEA90498.1 helix-turn-helix domain-containing protein [Streptomyces sp. SID14436]NEC82996.1 helix-turn-helix domain-containing protein [Streptomyces sp. SID7958]